jgi:flagellar hook-length control protein FliK
MVRSISIHRLGDQTRLRMEVSTPRLRRLTVALQIQAGRLHARLGVQGEVERELLRGATEELENGLRQRGIEVAAMRVEIEDLPRGSTQDSRGDRQQRHGTRRSLPEATASGPIRSLPETGASARCPVPGRVV